MRIRNAAFTAAIGICLLVLTGCAPTPIDTDDSDSVALVEEFFAHLEAGEARDAAALTDMDFTEEALHDDFYRASAALPSDARIVETSGYDSGGFSATVEYTLEGAAQPGVLEGIRVADRDGELKIIGWRSDSPVSIGSIPAAGTVTINGRLELVLADENDPLALLPAAYAVEYRDPTGLLRLAGQDSAFTAYVPEMRQEDGTVTGKGFSFVPLFLPDVEPGLYAAIEQLQAACAAERFVGPSCPDDLVSVLHEPPDGSVTAEWFPDGALEFRLVDGAYEATASYEVYFSGDAASHLTVSYTGSVTRDAAGGITFTR